MKIIRMAVERPVTTAMFYSALVLVGMIALLMLPLELARRPFRGDPGVQLGNGHGPGPPLREGKDRSHQRPPAHRGGRARGPKIKPLRPAHDAPFHFVL